MRPLALCLLHPQGATVKAIIRERTTSKDPVSLGVSSVCVIRKSPAGPSEQICWLHQLFLPFCLMIVTSIASRLPHGKSMSNSSVWLRYFLRTRSR